MNAKIDFEVHNLPSSQTLAEMELWKPPQGTVRQMIPVDVEVRFGSEIVQTPNLALRITARRAEIHLVLNNATVVRGSRFGDKINEPYIVAEIQESLRTILETETSASMGGEFAVQQNIFGKLFASFSWRRTKNRKRESDNNIKLSSRISRVIARNGNKWLIVEPLHPHILDGRFLAEAQPSDTDKSSPLCLISSSRQNARATLYLLVPINHLVITSEMSRAASALSRNQEAIISQLAQRGIERGAVTFGGLQPQLQGDHIVLACSSMEMSIADH